MPLVVVLLAWFVLSIPVSLILGHVIAGMTDENNLRTPGPGRSRAAERKLVRAA